MILSHILPTDLLYLIKDRPFHMCLANIAIKNSDYLNFYKQQSADGKFILLDNGAAESDQMTLDIMMDIIKEIQPSEVILNDKLLDPDTTIEQSYISLDYYRSHNYHGQFMFVAQGEDIEDWLTNFSPDNCNLIQYVHTIGIPKIIERAWSGKYWRYNCASYIKDNFPTKNIHLLGCNETPYDIMQYNDIFSVRSIDTALAYICTKAGVKLNRKRPNVSMDFISSNISNIDELTFNMNLFDYMIQ